MSLKRQFSTDERTDFLWVANYTGILENDLLDNKTMKTLNNPSYIHTSSGISRRRFGAPPWSNW